VLRVQRARRGASSGACSNDQSVVPRGKTGATRDSGSARLNRGRGGREHGRGASRRETWPTAWAYRTRSARHGLLLPLSDRLIHALGNERVYAPLRNGRGEDRPCCA
jgi:hypothetical protein